MGELFDTQHVRSLSTYATTGPLNEAQIAAIEAALYRAYNRARLRASSTLTSTYIPTGGSFDAYAAIVTAMKPARAEVFFIDGYVDETAFKDLLRWPLRASSSACSTTDRCSMAIPPLLEKWHEQHGATRPVEIRVAPRPALHDRAILVDGASGYAVSQSLKDLAARSPATLLLLPPEIAKLKADHYHGVWEDSPPLE